MILYRRGLPLLSQEEIGYQLGLTIPRAEQHLMPTARSADTPPSTAGWGTQIDLDEYSINKFFDTSGYPLVYRYVGPEDFPSNTHEWLAEKISNDTDVICCFNYKAAYGEGGDNGHVNLLESLANDAVTLVEPAPDEPKHRALPLDKLLESMRFHTGKNSGGFWLIEARD